MKGQSHMVLSYIAKLATSLPVLPGLRNGIIIFTVKFIVIIAFVLPVEAAIIIIIITCILQVSFTDMKMQTF